MNWTISYSKQFEKSIKKLDKPIKEQVYRFLKKLKESNDPLNFGEQLVGGILGRFWKFRVGDYRIIFEVHEEQLILHLIDINHRSEVYKNRY